MTWGIVREVRDLLSPDVDPHGRSFLGRPLWGMPGPVWSMVAWDAVMFVVMLLNALLLGLRSQVTAGHFLPAAFWGVSAVVVARLGGRMPGWVIHLLLDVNILVTCWVSLVAPNDLRASANLMFLIVPAVFAATWLPRQQMAAHLLVLIIGSGVVVIAHSSDGDMVRVWIVLMVVSVGIAYFINALVHHLNEQAVVDSLTGLRNRSGLAAVADSYARRGSSGPLGSVVVIDLDDFKAVNDRHGHEAGDQVLREVADAMREHLRPYDTLSRTGGDEFAVVLMRTDEDQAVQIVERLVEAFPISCSFGIATWPAGVRLEEAMVEADARMYLRKAAKSKTAEEGPSEP